MNNVVLIASIIQKNGNISIRKINLSKHTKVVESMNSPLMIKGSKAAKPKKIPNYIDFPVNLPFQKKYFQPKTLSENQKR